MLRTIILVSVLFYCNLSQEQQEDKEFFWSRWEKRTIECRNGTKGVECALVAPNAQPPRDPATYKCRVEPMPKQEWNKLPKSETRLACPIGCEPDFDLSVITKVPPNNNNCQKYYTYGKYRDNKENEWYLWLTEPCVASLTTHCRFQDVDTKGLIKKKKALRQ